MAKVAREMVEKTGIDVDELVELLVANAAAELTTFYYYTIMIQNPSETGRNFDSRRPPYQCTFNEYGLKTKFDVTYTITSADHNASTKKNFGGAILLATGISVAASIFDSF